MIDGTNKPRTLKRQCHLYGVSRSGYYAWRTRPESRHAQHDLLLKEAITELHQGFRRSYGARRVHQALRQQGYSCSIRRIGRLMKALNIKPSTTGLYVWSPGKHAFYEGSGNKLKEQGIARQAGTQWAGDFTYINTQQGYLYFAVVLDLYTRKVIGWAGARQRNAGLTKSALVMALNQHTPQAGCLFHSDQGIEYAAHEFRNTVLSANMVLSMSRKGTPMDNAMVESFFHSLKTEAVQRKVYATLIEAMAEIVSYIGYYNHERLHSALDYQSPVNYEKLCA